MLTLFVDASFSHQQGKAGWGAWAIHDSWDRGRTFGAKMFGITNNTSAELIALGEAVRMLQERQWWPRDVVMLQSDSHHALSALSANLPNTRTKNHRKDSVAFSNKSPTLLPKEEEAIRVIKLATFGFQVYLRHIKGHTGVNKGRNWVNQQCDRIARQYMRA